LLVLLIWLVQVSLVGRGRGTESRAQYTHNPSVSIHNPRANFLDSVKSLGMSVRVRGVDIRVRVNILLVLLIWLVQVSLVGRGRGGGYLGMQSTESRAQYTHNPSVSIHNPRANFLDSVKW
jgi:hypothetical protein